MEFGIPEWYAGKKVFVTGGTGFMGKVLIEKLLRCCPDVDKIYVLSRHKRGVTPKQRISEFSNLPIFEKVLKERPNVMEKLEIVEGDLLKEDMALRPEDKRILSEEVNVIFHLGATVRLECGIKASLEHNTHGTLKVLELAKTMKNIQAFVHVSTAFCYCELTNLEETLYPPLDDPRRIMDVVLKLTEDEANILAKTLIKDFPNSYTYSKRLAEILVEEYGDTLPVVIVRPSIVLPAIFEPLPGWVDNLNGPIGLCVGAGKGVLKSLKCDPENKLQYIPVDAAINALIAAAWQRPNTRIEKGNVPVYNVTSGHLQVITNYQVFVTGREILVSHPFEGGLTYPSGIITTNPFKHALMVFFLQTIPAYVVDFILMLLGHKPFMIRLQNKIAQGCELMSYFNLRKWTFKIDRLLSLTDKMNERDQQTFYILNRKWDFDEYILASTLGVRVYCLKEPLSSLPKARRHIKFLYCVQVALQCLLACVVSLLFMKMYYWLTS